MKIGCPGLLLINGGLFLMLLIELLIDGMLVREGLVIR
jgi:hypothetical protein